MVPPTSGFLAAGTFLLVKRPFKVGETVNVAGVQGKVDEMTLSSCLIITEEQHHVTVPNAKIWATPSEICREGDPNNAVRDSNPRAVCWPPCVAMPKWVIGGGPPPPVHLCRHTTVV